MYYSQLKRVPRDERDLVDMLRAGHYTCYSLETAMPIDYEIQPCSELCQV